ncbi:solute carrier family 25 member 35-like isoform X2 [Phymastichus coffea]|uniref:solute carrier family 25 member 35-like isoform X2 n=1 Tax=Phymastichus coffea TaxID=108790 RepID=UPI00273AB2CE|nr:solute carrier family 25 member 35-like isoform X2 [Phymastichus coffea]
MCSLGLEFAIGGLAGVGTALLTNPADMLKTRLQLQGELAAPGTYEKAYTSTFQAARTIVMREGIMTLQAGIMPVIGLQVIINGARLGSYFFAKRMGLIVNESGETIVWRTALLSGVVSSIAFMIGSPLYLAKVKLHAYSGSRNLIGYPTDLNTRSIFKSLWQQGGIKKVYSGWYSNTPRLFIGSAVQITVFGLVMDYMKQIETLSNEKLLSTFIASSIAGTCLVLTVHPLDVMSTRIYNQGSKSQESKKLYNGMMDVIWKTVKAEGFSGLYKGVFPNWLRYAPYVIISQGLYQKITGMYEELHK